jgi:neutral ceramidase
MSQVLDRRQFLQLAGAAPLAAQVRGSTLKAGTAKIDITPDRPRFCASGDKPDPPVAYARLHSRVLTLFDGARRIVFVNYDLNCLDVATPILRERVEQELHVTPEYLVLLATHNHQGPIQIAAENFDYGRDLAEKIFGAIREASPTKRGPRSCCSTPVTHT